jgi:hypothetical protein
MSIHVGAYVICCILVSGIVRLGREGVQSVAHEPVIGSLVRLFPTTCMRWLWLSELSPFVAYVCRTEDVYL